MLGKCWERIFLFIPLQRYFENNDYANNYIFNKRGK